MSTIFSKIINREIPGFIVGEDEYNLAFLDINPLSVGHTLVVPKTETDYLFDLTDDAYISLNLFAKKMAVAIKKVTGKRIGTAVIGLEVPHVHIHLIPFTKMSELNFTNPKLKLTREEFADTKTSILKEFNKLG